jgi:hypothetical protein
MLTLARERVEQILDDGREGLLDPDLIYEIRKTFSGIQNT